MYLSQGEVPPDTRTLEISNSGYETKTISLDHCSVYYVSSNCFKGLKCGFRHNMSVEKRWTEAIGTHCDEYIAYLQHATPEL